MLEYGDSWTVCTRTAEVSKWLLTPFASAPGASGTAVATTFSYDNADRLTTITDQITGGARLATYVYGYDNANRVTSETNTEGTVSYTYDATNELTGASGSRAETYTYDLNGNRTMTGYSTGSGNELTASPSVTYTYDNEGDMTAAANTSTHVVTSYTYDYHNRLIGVTVGGTAVATYVYDALDRRIGIQDNGTQTWVVWDGQNPYADFNGSGSLTMRYVYGRAIDELLARTSSAGTTAWYLTDRLGTVRDIVSTSGTALDHVVYDSFGNVTSESAASNGDRFKFTGRELDSVTGLQDNRARVYSALIGRFVQEDPAGYTAGDTNLYRYVSNGPINAKDSTGLMDETEGGPKMNAKQLALMEEMQKSLIETIKRQIAVREKQKDKDAVEILEATKAALETMKINEAMLNAKFSKMAFAMTKMKFDEDKNTIANTYFQSATFKRTSSALMYTLLHETAHIVDFTVTGARSSESDADALASVVYRSLKDKAFMELLEEMQSKLNKLNMSP